MKKTLFYLLCLCSLSSCKDNTIFGEITLRGQVIEASTGRPLDSVVVQLYEDNEGPFMGKKVIREIITDGSGTFQTKFKYKEGPYVLKAFHPRYSYFRIVKNIFDNSEMAVDYQNVDEFKKNQQFTFDMENFVQLDLHLKNVQPASASDELTLSIQNLNKRQKAYSETFSGTAEITKAAGMVTSNRYLTIQSTLKENGALTSRQDTIFIRPNQKNTFYLEY